MSWKGFQKGIARTPQALRQKMNKDAASRDLVFEDAERRFLSIEALTKKLQTEATRYVDALNKLLIHQIEYSRVIEQLYRPISGALSDPNALVDDSNPEAIAACQQYRSLMEELHTLLKPDLDMVETQILQPCTELVAIIESTKKVLAKRSHKQLDLDRHTASLRKVQDRDDRNTRQEEKMFKVEGEYEAALEEFTYFNDLVKTELPQLFALEAAFIKPLFESFYFMQLNVVYTMQTHLEEMKIPYFDLDGDLVASFQAKRGDVLAKAEAIPITHFAHKPTAGRTGRFGKPPTAAMAGHSLNGGAGAAAGGAGAGAGGIQTAADGSRRWAGTLADEFDDEEAPPPRYADEAEPAAAPARPARPNPPGRRRPEPAAEFCVALYDFAAQAAGDLPLRAGDRIEVLNRKDDPEGWWTGRIGKEQGVFPATYVQLE